MKLIEQEPHFWELYQNNEHYYLSVAVDMSSVVSCWDLVLPQSEIDAYQVRGRVSIEVFAKTIIDAAYKGYFSVIDRHLASEQDKQAMHSSYQAWRANQTSFVYDIIG